MADDASQTPAGQPPSIQAGTLFSVPGLVAVVTGGGSGIGRMLTTALATNGAAKVYILGRREAVLREAAAAIGPNVHALVCDVSATSSLAAAAATVARETGHVDLLLCNAGVGGPQVKAPTEGMTAAAWAAQHLDHAQDAYTRTFDVNVSAVWYTTMAFLALLDAGNKRSEMKKREGGAPPSSQVIVTSSIGAFNKTAPGGWAYGQSKAAVTLLAKHLAGVLPRWDIRANCIAPGCELLVSSLLRPSTSSVAHVETVFPSEMAAPIVKLYTGDGQDMPKAMIPMQRMGDEQDMAGVLLFLASRAGAYCNGAVIKIDGGRLENFPSTWCA
ncbi:short chain dehydrogenase [Verticillium dahliae]|nr:short chain dehydrogenase [Verticillium dahliae]